MYCPKCRHLSKVIRTIKSDTLHIVIRRRICEHCGLRFLTTETPDKTQDPKEVKDEHSHQK